MPRVAIAAVKACERSQEPCGRGDCERDLPINVVFGVDCNSLFLYVGFDSADFCLCFVILCLQYVLHVLN